MINLHAFRTNQFDGKSIREFHRVQHDVKSLFITAFLTFIECDCDIFIYFRHFILP